MLTRLNMYGPNRDRPLINRITESSFTGQTIPAEFEPLPSLEEPDPVGSLMDVPRAPGVKQVITAVTNMLSDLEEGEERNAVLRQWLTIAERVEAVVVQTRERHREQLRQQIADLTPQCRAALDRVRELTEEGRSLLGQLHMHDERVSAARLKLREAERNKPPDENFPTEDEMAKWSAEMQRCRTALTRVQEPRDALREQIQRNDALRLGEQARLNELKRQREDARAELAGRPRSGPFGLRVPGSV